MTDLSSDVTAVARAHYLRNLQWHVSRIVPGYLAHANTIHKYRFWWLNFLNVFCNVGIGGHKMFCIQVEYLLTEWVRLYHQPISSRDSEKLYAAYLGKVQVS